MASYMAVAAVAEAVIQLLRGAYRPDLLDGHELDFRVYVAQDFVSPMLTGVSLFPYRIFAHGSQGMSMKSADGGRLPGLPLEVHFLLTAWGNEASLQNGIAGWMMRVLADSPTLSQGLLNTHWEGVFTPAESVQVVLGDLTTEDLLHMWEALAPGKYHISVPYIARVLEIESLLPPEAVRLAVVREFGGGGDPEPRQS